MEMLGVRNIPTIPRFCSADDLATLAAKVPLRKAESYRHELPVPWRAASEWRWGALRLDGAWGVIMEETGRIRPRARETAEQAGHLLCM